MPSSHRRHGQDKTKLSCLVRVDGVNTTGDKTRQFCLVSTQFIISKFSVIVVNIIDTVANCKLGRDKTQFTPHFETGQNCKKLNMFSLDIFCLRQSWLVYNSVHITDKTRQDKTVLTCLQFSSHHRQDKTRQDSLDLSPIQFTSPTWTRQDKTVLTCRQFSSHHRQDKTRQSCLVRVGGVNWALQIIDERCNLQTICCFVFLSLYQFLLTFTNNFSPVLRRSYKRSKINFNYS